MNDIKHLSGIARKNAAAALEKMKDEQDKSAKNDAMHDGPNAGWHYKNTAETKEVIDKYIKLLEAKSYESAETLVLETIIAESIKAGKGQR